MVQEDAMTKHVVAIVGRRMEAVLEIEAASEDEARRIAMERSATLTEADWYIADEIEVLDVERLMTHADEAAAGISAW